MFESEEPIIKFQKRDEPWVVFEHGSSDLFNEDYPLTYIHQIKEFTRKHFEKEKENNEKIFLSFGNNVSLPEELIEKLNWQIGDEIYADIFDEDLKQIVIGKKLERGDAVKALDKISDLLND